MNQMLPLARFEAPTGDLHDFDFLYGNWSVLNRRLTQRWVGSEDWDVFTGVHRCEPRLGVEWETNWGMEFTRCA